MVWGLGFGVGSWGLGVWGLDLGVSHRCPKVGLVGCEVVPQLVVAGRYHVRHAAGDALRQACEQHRWHTNDYALSYNPEPLLTCTLDRKASQ